MKKTDTQQETLCASAEQLEKAREELRARTMYEELESTLRLEVVDGLMTRLKIDHETFRRLWIEPLLAVGATFDEALACIAESHIQPN
jgi:hypothetical protein